MFVCCFLACVCILSTQRIPSAFANADSADALMLSSPGAVQWDYKYLKKFLPEFDTGMETAREIYDLLIESRLLSNNVMEAFQVNFRQQLDAGAPLRASAIWTNPHTPGILGPLSRTAIAAKWQQWDEARIWLGQFFDAYLKALETDTQGLWVFPAADRNLQALVRLALGPADIVRMAQGEANSRNDLPATPEVTQESRSLAEKMLQQAMEDLGKTIKAKSDSLTSEHFRRTGESGKKLVWIAGTSTAMGVTGLVLGSDFLFQWAVMGGSLALGGTLGWGIWANRPIRNMLLKMEDPPQFLKGLLCPLIMSGDQ